MKVIEVIARHYGIETQCRQTIEEMAELTQAITKFWRYSGTDANKLHSLTAHIAEELADVEIMIEQLKILFDVRNEVSETKTGKLLRQLERIENE